MSVDHIMSTRERLVARRRAEQGLPPKRIEIVAPAPPPRAKRTPRDKPVRTVGPYPAKPASIRTVVCRECGTIFPTRSSTGIMCSDECRLVAQRNSDARRRERLHPVTTRNCANCGQPFEHQWKSARYCSYACKTKFGSKTKSARRKEQEALSGNTQNQ